MYSREEVFAAASRYVEQHDLSAMEGGVVLLDAPLAHALFQGAIKKGQPVPQHVPARDLSELILRRMLPQNRLVRGHLSAVRKGELPEVHVRTEKRAGSRARVGFPELYSQRWKPKMSTRFISHLPSELYRHARTHCSSNFYLAL